MDIKVSLKTHQRYLLNIGVVLVVVPCHGIVGCSNAQWQRLEHVNNFVSCQNGQIDISNNGCN